MKTMWTFSITKGWYKSENSLADLTTPDEARRYGFKQMNTHPQIHQTDRAIRQAVFFQRVKKTGTDYLARYTIGDVEFWFYIPNTAAFIEVLCRHRPIIGPLSTFLVGI